MKITDTKLQELKNAIAKSEETFQAKKDKLQVALDKSTNDIEQATDNLNKAKLGDDPTAYSEARKALQLAKDSKEFFNHKLSSLEKESLLTDEALAEATANKEKAEAEVSKLLSKIEEIANEQASYTKELNDNLKSLGLPANKDGFKLTYFNTYIQASPVYKEIVK
ncbi:hypothetical protein PML80_04255 [Aerococcus urinaeequi]|uniref:Uncharacterized protein n=1 Tax=Aerococcus urinaeequi TaxID=51665 RepID=A0AAE9XKV2_9LACT|nr:hypothetical protein [Aerococcus urinaeequi]WCG38546.1 hypothetical protein PML80_04255 [Aerococcus urinaeequi]